MNLTARERETLTEVLRMHLQGMQEAREAMLEDRATLSDLDTFSEVFQMHDQFTHTCQSILKKVEHDRGSRNLSATSTVRSLLSYIQRYAGRVASSTK